MLHTAAELQAEEASRDLFRKGLLDGEQHQVLAAILARLGTFNDQAGSIHPELIAFGNWLLGKCGIVHTMSPDHFSLQIYSIAAALARTASLQDLADARASLPKEGMAYDELES